MIKKSVFTLMFLAVMGWVSAQSLQFEYEGHVFADGETVECMNDEYGYGEFIQHMQMKNLTSGDLSVVVEKEVIQDLENTSNFFCWGMCYGPDIYVSNPVTVAANSLNTDDLSFHVLFMDPDLYGKVKVKYSAYVEGNASQRITINVVFIKSGVGVQESTVAGFGQAYPNPASSVVNFDYSLSAGDRVSVTIYNLLGQEVTKQQVNGLQGRLSISVADLNDGIYFCNLFVNGSAVKSEKFVVKK